MRSICFIVFFLLASAAHAERVNVPIVRQVRGSGPAADMKSRLRDWSILGGRGSVGHYCAHGLHSQIRNQHGGTNNVNAIYIGDGVAYVFPEPRNVRLSEVVRGPTPMLSRDWEHQPLYLLDEFGAYVASTWVSVHERRDTEGSYHFARQMLAQCRRLVVLCRQRGYSHADELDGVVEGGADALDELGTILGE